MINDDGHKSPRTQSDRV